MIPHGLQTRDARAHLEVRDKPYYARITSALHLGYRKSKSIARWVVRRRTATGYRTQVLMGVVPDDRIRANGVSVLSYQQAVIRAMNMDTKDPQPKLAHLSFCRKPQTGEKLLIAGPNAFACNECVRLCNDIIENRDRSAAGPQPHA